MFYHLPPVGTAISVAGNADDLADLEALFSPYAAHFYASGTAALASAVAAARQRMPVDQPEVLVPAYGCPDLVSAVLYAGARPVLVDLEPERPWMNLQRLQDLINKHTVAIVAVHLFGILERIGELSVIAKNAGIVLIEDSAQAFPGQGEAPFWRADLVVLSFGRGKPVSALAGGAVLCKDENLGRMLNQPPRAHSPGLLGRLKNILKIKTYNVLLSPRWYWLPNSLPFLHLGETRFHPLESIAGLDTTTIRRVAVNAKRYRRYDLRRQEQVHAALAGRDLEGRTVVDLPDVCGQAANRRLLRYPLLVSQEKRDRCLQSLNRAGLGATTMYPASLPGIDGLEVLLRGQGRFVEAERFARRLITLPVHPGVRTTDVDKMIALITE